MGFAAAALPPPSLPVVFASPLPTPTRASLFPLRLLVTSEDSYSTYASALRALYPPIGPIFQSCVRYRGSRRDSVQFFHRSHSTNQPAAVNPVPSRSTDPSTD